MITSGGGFSSSIKAHSWQSSAIASYFATIQGTSNAPASGYNAQGRGYPDISAIAVNYPVIVGGSFSNLYGTSASSPVFAGMISLINAQRKRLGFSPVGWINPSLYQYAANFTVDVVSGDNRCCLQGNPCCTEGFHASTGWDPATGLGTVNFTAMSSMFMNLAQQQQKAQAQQATTRPSFTPTLVPSATTTVYPTVTTGFLYSYLYDAQECTGTVVSIQAFPVQSCLPVFGTTASNILYYRRYSCSIDSQQGMMQTYSDSNCVQLLSTTTYSLNSCSVVADSYYYFTGNNIYYSSQLFCTTASTANVNTILPANGIGYLRNM